MKAVLNAPGPGKLAGLEAFLAEDGTPLGRLERDGGLLAARGTRGNGFDALASDRRPRRPRRAFRFTRLAALRLVLEVLVGEELLLARRPDELRATVHAPEDPVLELHRSLPRPGSVVVDSGAPTPVRAGASCDSACGRAPASPAVYHLASSRRSAS